MLVLGASPPTQPESEEGSDGKHTDKLSSASFKQPVACIGKCILCFCGPLFSDAGSHCMFSACITFAVESSSEADSSFQSAGDEEEAEE